MKKLLYLVVLGAVLIAACGGGSGAHAASVDGRDVTVGQVDSLIDSGEETISKEQFAQFLSFQIQWIVINDSAEADYGITVTDDEVATEADRIFSEAAPEEQTREEFLSERGITEEFLANIARQGLIDQQIREILIEDVAEPTEDEIDAARQEAIDAGTTVCVSHVLVATEEEAEDVLTRIEDGEELGELAVELSLDTGSGENNGILPCGPASGYVPPFMEASLVAPVGEVYGEVVQTEFGFHVIQVTDRQEPGDDDLPTDDELASRLRGQVVADELGEWFLAAVGDADVAVEEEYGTWQANPPNVIPPAA